MLVGASFDDENHTNSGVDVKAILVPVQIKAYIYLLTY